MKIHYQIAAFVFLMTTLFFAGVAGFQKVQEQNLQSQMQQMISRHAQEVLELRNTQTNRPCNGTIEALARICPREMLRCLEKIN